MTPRRSNLIGDLYVQNIKQFKPTPLTQAQIDSAVQSFKLPAKPSIPKDEISTEAVQEYEAAEVETQTVDASGSEVVVEEDWFVFEEPEEAH